VAPAADNALIVPSDCSVLLEVHAPRADEARAALAPFAELVKSPSTSTPTA
jgi:DNA excision repair protein ERCC-3